jgi:uncharacterized membrane protein
MNTLRTLFLTYLLVQMLAGCATGRIIGYRNDIQPLLESKCYRCHLPPDGEGFLKTGLNMQTYETLMAGTYYGKVIISGDSRRSILNKLVEGRAGTSMLMPHDSGSRLSDEEIQILRLWVEQGAKYN